MECSVLGETINEINFRVFFGFFILFYQALKTIQKKIRLLKSGTIFNDFFTTEDISQFHPITIVCLLLRVSVNIENYQPICQCVSCQTFIFLFRVLINRDHDRLLKILDHDFKELLYLDTFFCKTSISKK